MPGVRWPCSAMLALSCVASAWAASDELARMPVRASGTLCGYFLRPSGRLRVRRVELSSEKPSGRLRELHPLWSGYYLRVTVESPGAAISAARLEAVPSGKELLALAPDEPQRVLRFSPWEDGWLRAHPKDGLTFRANATLEDGRTISLPLYPQGVQLLDIPEPKIDWLALVRIETVRKLLREVGDDILPGLRADDVPFALEGRDGQLVLVDHPRPPRGFREYLGPRPGRVTMHIGKRPWEEFGSPHTRRVGGVATAVLPFPPDWFALPDMGGEGRDASSACAALADIAHEVCHVVHWRRRGHIGFPLPPEAVYVPSVEARALEAAERKALSAALEDVWEPTVPPDDVNTDALRDYLALRECRWDVSKRHRALLRVEEHEETSEGFAYYAAWRLASSLEQKVSPTPLSLLDPFAGACEGYAPLDAIEGAFDEYDPTFGWGLGRWLRIVPSYHGAGQAEALYLLAPQLLRDAWDGGLGLREALERAAGYEDMGAAEQEKLKAVAVERWGYAKVLDDIRSESEAGSRELEEAIASADGRSALALNVNVEVRARGERRPLPKRSPAVYLDDFRYFGSDGSIVISDQPCLVRIAYAKRRCGIEMQTVLASDDGPLWVRKEGAALNLRTQEVLIRIPDARVDARDGSLFVRGRSPGNESGLKKPKKEGEAKVRRAAWMVVPLALAASSPQVLAQCENDTLEFWITGDFLDADTGQQQLLTVDLMQDAPWPPGNWETVEGESYSVSLTYSSSCDAVGEVALYDPDGNLMDIATADPPTNTLTAEGAWVATLAAKIEPKVDIKFPPIAPGITVGGSITFKPGETRAFEVHVENAPEAKPASARVTLLRQNHPDFKMGPEATNGGGVRFDPVPKGSDYVIEVQVDGEPRCHLRRGTFKRRKKGTTNVTFQVYMHGVIKGKFRFRDPQGNEADGDPWQVTVQLLKDGQLFEDCMVGDVKDEAGAYPYHSMPGPAPGGYEVRATYGPSGEQLTGNVTVPDECTATFSGYSPPITVVDGGPHNDVNGPNFTFIVGGEAPPGGGGEPPPEGGEDPPPGGEDPPPEGGGDPPPGA